MSEHFIIGKHLDKPIWVQGPFSSFKEAYEYTYEVGVDEAYIKLYMVQVIAEYYIHAPWNLDEDEEIEGESI